MNKLPFTIVVAMKLQLSNTRSGETVKIIFNTKDMCAILITSDNIDIIG